MKKTATEIDGLFVLEPRIFEDDRGHFFESYNHQAFSDLIGEPFDFVQDNQSLSNKGVLRGMHFQCPPYEQGKLVRVTVGSVLDVVVDIRKESLTYGKSFSVELSATNSKMLWIPPGFAHGFLSLEDNTVFNYKCTNYYDKDSERNLLWNDPDLHLEWPVQNPALSPKDLIAENFDSFVSPF